MSRQMEIDRTRSQRVEPTHARSREGRTGLDWLERFGKAVRLRDRLKLLAEFGLTDRDIAKATPDTAERSIRRWRKEGPPATKVSERWDPIDDLFAVINFFLADGSYDDESIVAWLRSRHPALESCRPLDVLGEGNFSAVLAAAEQTLSPGGITEEDSFFSTHPGRQADMRWNEQRKRHSVRRSGQNARQRREIPELTES